MRQGKDRSGKWILGHHGDSILRLSGVTGFRRRAGDNIPANWRLGG